MKDSYILKSLEPMFKEAEEKGLWFFTDNMGTGPLWFSPRELRERHKNGVFIWGIVNWRLRYPLQHLQELQENIDYANNEYHKFMDRLAKEEALWG